MEATATTCILQSFRLATGSTLFHTTLVPAVLAAEHEIVFITCFWAPSESLRALSDALAELAARRRRRWQQQQENDGEQDTPEPPLRVRIGFSSRSLLQKLLHTSAPAGYVYPPAAWSAVLGLPPAETLRAGGIDLSVKSLFFLPFSVMHPKLVVVDRRRAFLPSCNVSWEPWLEACVEVTGAAVSPLLAFYAATWQDALPPLTGNTEVPEDPLSIPAALSGDAISPIDVHGPGSIVAQFASAARPRLVAVEVLPSPHHRNPRFCLPPATPLNDALQRLFASATQSVFVVTPNLTAAPAIDALLATTARGVPVTVVTSDRMMVWEQLLTAWTTTARCVRRMTAQHTTLRQRLGHHCGRLRVLYYQTERVRWQSQSQAAPEDEEQAAMLSTAQEPLLCHVKLSIVDAQHTMLGSGNMDRASWFTSQELGLLVHDAVFARQVQSAIDYVLDGRMILRYDR